MFHLHSSRSYYLYPLPEDLRREEEIVEPEGIDVNWTRIGEEVTEVLEHKPGDLYVRRIVLLKYVLRKDWQHFHCCLFHGVMPEPVYWQNC